MRKEVPSIKKCRLRSKKRHFHLDGSIKREKFRLYNAYPTDHHNIHIGYTSVSTNTKCYQHFYKALNYVGGKDKYF